MHLIVWGTYDLGKPRTRIVIAALRQAGFELVEIHRDVWQGIADKSQQDRGGWLGRTLATLLAWPGLIWRYLRAPDHAAIVVPYMGVFDVLVLWPFARMRGKPIIWDAFLSLYDTVVTDRAMLKPRAWPARGLRLLEQLACRAAARVVLDTQAHAELFAELYGVPREKLAAIMVGAEREAFAPIAPAPPAAAHDPVQVLFYGQFIPLHGIETIVRAARLAAPLPIRWTLIGQGQEAPRIAAMLAETPLPELEWIHSVDYEALAAQIAQADVCLGIFANRGKALRVIPNKVFQVLSAGRPLVTADTAAMRELVGGGAPGVYLVPPGDPGALLGEVQRFCEERHDLPAILHEKLRARFSIDRLSRHWAELVAETCTPGERR